MNTVSPLPSVLVNRYKGWRATKYEENKSWYQKLAESGQNPRTMIISCCDSRMQISSLFELDMGEVFTHQNIANLVPEYKPDDAMHGTSAAIEFAVKALQVTNIIVLGHSKCGGVNGAFDMCHSGHAEPNDFLNNWLEQLRPAYDRSTKSENLDTADLTKMEQESVMVSVENLFTFPFVREAVEQERLSIHALWNDIGKGMMFNYVSDAGEFVPL